MAICQNLLMKGHLCMSFTTAVRSCTVVIRLLLHLGHRETVIIQDVNCKGLILAKEIQSRKMKEPQEMYFKYLRRQCAGWYRSEPRCFFIGRGHLQQSRGLKWGTCAANVCMMYQMSILFLIVSTYL